MKEIEPIDNNQYSALFSEINRCDNLRLQASSAVTSRNFWNELGVAVYTLTVIMWVVCLSVSSGFMVRPQFGWPISVGVFVLGLVLSIPFAIFKILRSRNLKKPIEERRTPLEKDVMVDQFACYASAINEAVEALNADLVRWNAYAEAVAAGMQSVTSDDEGLYAVLVSRKEALIAHAKKFNFLRKNKSTKTKAIGFPELAAKVSEAEKEFSAVEPAATAKVYREQIRGPDSELEDLRKSSGLTGIRVEAAAQKAGVSQEAEAEVVLAIGEQALANRS